MEFENYLSRENTIGEFKEMLNTMELVVKTETKNKIKNFIEKLGNNDKRKISFSEYPSYNKFYREILDEYKTYTLKNDYTNLLKMIDKLKNDIEISYEKGKIDGYNEGFKDALLRKDEENID